MPLNDPGAIEHALTTARTIAVVGCSPDAGRPSHVIARYLIQSGYDVVPVNPEHAEVLGLRSYPELLSIPSTVRVDIVDVFRRSEHVPAVARAALARGVGFFWMQEGVIDPESAARLLGAGIPVAMDRCIYREREELRHAGRLS